MLLGQDEPAGTELSGFARPCPILEATATTAALERLALGAAAIARAHQALACRTDENSIMPRSSGVDSI